MIAFQHLTLSAKFPPYLPPSLFLNNQFTDLHRSNLSPVVTKREEYHILESFEAHKARKICKIVSVNYQRQLMKHTLSKLNTVSCIFFALPKISMINSQLFLSSPLLQSLIFLKDINFVFRPRPGQKHIRFGNW